MGSEEDGERRPKMKKRKYVIEDVVMRTNNKIEPLLVNFANGQPLEGSELKGTLHRREKQGVNSTHKLLTIKTPFLGYAGSQTNAQMPVGMTMFLGILDSHTGKMRLIETSQYTVQPVLKDTAFHNASKGPDEVNTYDEKQEAIAASFGSKKAKQAVARRRQNRVETDTMSGAIDQAAAAAGDQALGVEEFMEQQEGTSLITILPPCDRKATTILDVYKLGELAPDDFLAQLQEQAEALLGGQDPGPTSTLLFREMVENARHEHKFGNQLRLACVALLVKHLVAFLDCKNPLLRDFGKGRIMTDCCNGVVAWIMQEYTLAQGNFITKTKKDEDRAFCLSLILAFISSRYELSVSTLLQSIPIKRDRLDLLMKVIGANYSTSSHSYVLKLPLAKYSQNFKKSKKPKKR
ncbi:DNA-directed RNA polymerase I subunit RPA49 [Chionoecetes opilio]|uniref:DNA-directed RNA polymerase I subunit RPA49 n=1 Tax=Chionoecetes opilio TaxID=41210 RepID=A0A8J4XU17_CHIOP|nr:DNA-directed RNA polymerase I subunit RPA49 [Chionoecetes opilio]